MKRFMIMLAVTALIALVASPMFAADKPDQVKPDQSAPDQAKPDQAKPDQAKPDQTSTKTTMRIRHSERTRRVRRLSVASVSEKAILVESDQLACHGSGFRPLRRAGAAVLIIRPRILPRNRRVHLLHLRHASGASGDYNMLAVSAIHDDSDALAFVRWIRNRRSGGRCSSGSCNA